MLFMWSFTACLVRLPEPTLDAVEPTRGWNGEDTVITIEGSGFVPQVQVNVNRGGQTDLDRGYVARLDGANARNEQDAATATGLKGFPAKKALQNYNRLGGPATKRALELLAGADSDLRGGKDLDAELIMEVLVARLSKLR